MRDTTLVSTSSLWSYQNLVGSKKCSYRFSNFKWNLIGKLQLKLNNTACKFLDINYVVQKFSFTLFPSPANLFWYLLSCGKEGKCYGFQTLFTCMQVVTYPIFILHWLNKVNILAWVFAIRTALEYISFATQWQPYTYENHTCRRL